MATSQEYLREIALRIEPEYSGALRDAADLIDSLQLELRHASQSRDAVLKAADFRTSNPESNQGCIICGDNHPATSCLYR